MKTVSADPDIASRTFSYRTDNVKSVDYQEFLDVQKVYPQKSNVKDDSDELKEKLLKDIVVPSFYQDVAQMENLVLYQGAHFLDKPHYEKQEQIMCAIDGTLSVVLVPHVNRQEVYSGQLDDSIFKDPSLKDSEQTNVAPVNFFIPNLEKFPLFRSATRNQVNLEAGDCVFIPAYYFYHVQGMHMDLNQFFPKIF